jgi:hypothetical protein
VKYQQPRFQLPATEGKGDCSQGHAMPDQKGKCIRCGEKVQTVAVERGERIVGYAHVNIDALAIRRTYGR